MSLPPNSPPRRAADILALGFGAAAAIAATLFLFGLPPGRAPSWAPLGCLLGWMAAGGWAAGRWTDRGWKGGLLVGCLAAALNLVLLGSLAGGAKPNDLSRQGLALAGALTIAGVALAAAGGARGSRRRAMRPASIDWTGVFALVAAAATFCLLAIGGAVTSANAGLAVVDWPNTFGHNMFLYPFAQMTGGVFYEHAHRLFGSLVGLTTLTLAYHLRRVERRAWVKRLSLAAIVLVIAQGTLGGLRVTGRFTLSASPRDMAPSLVLAAAHGIVGQVFFATLAVIALLALTVAVRAWALYGDQPIVQRFGKALIALTAAQLLLGIGALIVTGNPALNNPPTRVEMVVATAHQSVGAALLAVAAAHAAWGRRLLAAQAFQPAPLKAAGLDS
ncbi:MAG: hypothetical protein NTW86_22525 [Candidatus Sumerlaeota bacterium]|nr:hypothetical protein [Candidatus Sumerlaeota bacterium]